MNSLTFSVNKNDILSEIKQEICSPFVLILTGCINLTTEFCLSYLPLSVHNLKATWHKVGTKFE